MGQIVQELDNLKINYVFLRQESSVLSSLEKGSSGDIDIYIESNRVKEFFDTKIIFNIGTV